MKHEFSDALRADPERFELAQKAAKLLDDDTRQTVVRADAEWRLPADSVAVPYVGRSLVEVELRDRKGTSSVSQLFESDRDSILELRYRIARIWGELLDNRYQTYWYPLLKADLEAGELRA